MPNPYEDAVAALYRAALDQFVSERKRLAAELKQAGDKASAARFSKLGRPPLSAWAVNQLWWHAREPFERLLASGARLRGGDLGAGVAHQEALGRLRSRAAQLLADAGHSATEATLRRVSSTLSALAASGGFQPDAPGALSKDRDPPGFDAMELSLAGVQPASGGLPSDGSARAGGAGEEPSRSGAERRGGDAELRVAEERQRSEAERLERERLERERLERERLERERLAREEKRQRLAAERSRIEDDLGAARAEVTQRTAERDRLLLEVQRAVRAVLDAEARITELAARLSDLEARERDPG